MTTIEDEIIEKYAKETIMVKKAILKAIKKLNTGKSLKFLEKTYLETTNLELKTSIANALYEYKNSKEVFESLKNKGDLILKHVETPLIKFKEYV